MRASSSASILAVAAVAVGLAGCADVGGNSVPPSATFYDNTFDASEIGYITQFNPLPVFVRGGPLDSARGRQAAITALSSNGQRIGGLRFAPATAPGGNGYSVVMAYGAPVPGQNYCAGRADFPLAAPAASEITGNFCLGARLRSQVVVAVPPGELDSPQAAPALDRLAAALFSPGSRNRGRTNE
jgi:hypothetical protein